MIVMANKNDVQEVLKTDDVLVVQVKTSLTKDQFNLLSALVKKEEKESGLKIVVLPHSVEVKELKTDDEAAKKAEAEAKAKSEAEAKAKKEAEAKAKKEAEEKAKKEKEKVADK